jgi:hypothetical protein
MKAVKENEIKSVPCVREETVRSVLENLHTGRQPLAKLKPWFRVNPYSASDRYILECVTFSKSNLKVGVTRWDTPGKVI